MCVDILEMSALFWLCPTCPFSPKPEHYWGKVKIRTSHQKKKKKLDPLYFHIFITVGPVWWSNTALNTLNKSGFSLQVRKRLIMTTFCPLIDYGDLLFRNALEKNWILYVTVLYVLLMAELILPVTALCMQQQTVHLCLSAGFLNGCFFLFWADSRPFVFLHV